MTFYKKNCKAEVLFNLTYASGVIWRPVNYNHAWLVLKLSSMPLNEKKKKPAFFHREKTKHRKRMFVVSVRPQKARSCAGSVFFFCAQ